MVFNTISGKQANIFLNEYKISWKGYSASKFQYRVKQFFLRHFSHLEWFEEVALNGDLKALRVDFLCRFRDKRGNVRCVIIESDGDFHTKHIPFFTPTEDDFHDMLARDNCKEVWAAKNSIPLLRIYPENEPLSLEWFNETFNFPLGPPPAQKRV